MARPALRDELRQSLGRGTPKKAVFLENFAFSFAFSAIFVYFQSQKLFMREQL